MKNDATTVWDGIDVRVSLSDDGTMPRSVTSNSPDLICGGTLPIDNPAQLTDAANYGNAYGRSIYNKEVNYFYIRGKNLSAGPLTGYFHLYWAQSNLLLLPYTWAANNMKSGAGGLGLAFDAKATDDIIATTTDAFQWQPSNPDPGQHYCLVGQASNSLDPKVGIPTQNFPTAADFSAWFATNGNWAWRNTVFIATDTPDQVDTTHQIQTPTDSGLYNIYIECIDVPVGWAFQFTSGVEIPPQDPPNPINTITQPKTLVNTPNQIIGAHWTLPGNFGADINVSVWFNGEGPKPTTSWNLRINQVINDVDHVMYANALPLVEYDNPHPTVVAASKATPISKEVVCGNIEFLPKS